MREGAAGGAFLSGRPRVATTDEARPRPTLTTDANRPLPSSRRPSAPPTTTMGKRKDASDSSDKDKDGKRKKVPSAVRPPARRCSPSPTSARPR